MFGILPYIFVCIWINTFQNLALPACTTSIHLFSQHFPEGRADNIIPSLGNWRNESVWSEWVPNSKKAGIAFCSMLLAAVLLAPRMSTLGLQVIQERTHHSWPPVTAWRIVPGSHRGFGSENMDNSLHPSRPAWDFSLSGSCPSDTCSPMFCTLHMFVLQRQVIRLHAAASFATPWFTSGGITLP